VTLVVGMSRTAWPRAERVIEHGRLQHRGERRLPLVVTDLDEDRHDVAIGMTNLEMRRRQIIGVSDNVHS